jgi:bacteriophage protein of unknown function (DUF646)
VSIEAVIVGDDELRAKFQRASGTIDGKLVDSMGRITIRLQAHVVRNKLSGQVLKVRTNNLRGSIHQEVSRDGSGIVGRVGTNVEYAAFHEYGFSGTQNVREHMRTIKMAFGKMLKTPKRIVISAHARHVDYPEHSFLRSALDDQRTEIMAELGNAVKEAIQ